VKVEQLGWDESEVVFDWVMRLLTELGEEGDEVGDLNKPKLLREWKDAGDRFHVFVAKDEDNAIQGILTLTQSFAIYANGNYGIIDEMYVSPAFRSAGIGALLIKAAVDYGRGKGWARIDVTAPESDRWSRTRQFYEKEGFVFTGPKLKILLNS
jgi:GNAT superfamily N-acetyltransferase